MQQINYAEDIVPLSSFRSGMTRLMSQMRRTHRPVVVTQNGRATGVFLDIGDYQKLLDKIDLLMNICKEKGLEETLDSPSSMAITADR